MPNVPTSHSFRPNPNASIEEMLERINAITTKVGESKSQSDSGVFSDLELPNGAPIEMSNDHDSNGEFFPFEPETLADSKVSESMLEQLLCKFLMARGEVTVRQMSEQVGLPFHLVDDVVTQLKSEQLLGFIGQSAVNGYICKLTDAGRARAVNYFNYCSYFGTAPVAFSDYVASVQAQTIGNQHPGEVDLNRAFSDLLIDENMMTKLGSSLNSGKGMFLFGSAGNGKTSIAERITSAFGPYVWVPRTITVDRDIIRVFDPMSHEECPLDEGDGIISDQNFDHRWVRIKRPTIVVGGELTMAHLELQYNSQTGISEAPVQMKSNTGVLLIDDFGRQRMTVDELLNRWIVPLEKRYDYLNTSNGKKVQVPFDQLVVFSTNLEPKDLVDDAFLRRIPYKIEVPNPSIENFVRLFKIMGAQYGFEWRPKMIQYLIKQHYAPIKRELRNCHPRDLLLQARNYCRYFKRPVELTKESIDFACENYFSIM